MTWEHKGITFHLEQEFLGSFVMVSARVPSEGPFVRIRPFSALGRSEEEAIAMVKDQIRMEFKRVPETPEAINSLSRNPEPNPSRTK